MRLPSRRLAEQIQRQVEQSFYSSSAIYLSYPTPDDATYDEYGHASDEPAEIPIDSCSFTDRPNLEKWEGYADLEEIKAEIRFESPVPKKTDRVRVTGRFDSIEYKDQDFEIVGIRDRDVFRYVVALKEVRV